MTKQEEALKDQEVVEAIHKNTLRVLEEIGIAFLTEESRELLKKNGIKVEGTRAYFTEKQIMDALDTATKDFTVYARNEKYNVKMNTEDIYMTPAYGSTRICEADGTLRSAELDDFLKLANIFQASDEFSINGGIMVQPNDIDPKIAAEVMVYATLCRSDKVLFNVCDGKKNAENILKMVKIVFGDDITEKPCTFNLISPLAPLAYTQQALETAEVWAENGQPLVLCPAPMAGATGPISVVGDVTISNAEFLAGNVYAQLVRPGTPIIFGHAATVSDMQNMQVSNACPGFVKIAKYGAMLAKKYGVPCRSGGGMSNASGVTAQAGVESAMSMFESFTERANLMMHATGSLHSFNSVSFEKVLLDIETFTRMKYYFNETPADDHALAFDAIKEVIDNNSNFVVSSHTFERFRIDPWYSQVSLHCNTEGDPNQALYNSIQKRLDLLLDNYEYPEMPKDQRDALDALMRDIGMQESDMAKI